MKIFRLLPFYLLTLSVFGCGQPKIEKLESDAKILAFGDSLTSGMGAEPGGSYPAILEELSGFEVINAGVPGQDTAAGLARLPATLEEHQAQLVILCYGGNDMLNQQPHRQIAANLRKMVEAIKGSGADVVMIGVPSPGLLLRAPDFYAEIAEEFDAAYEGKILAEILSNASLKSDTIHPNEDGYRLMAERIFLLIKSSER